MKLFSNFLFFCLICEQISANSLEHLANDIHMDKHEKGFLIRFNIFCKLFRNEKFIKNKRIKKFPSSFRELN